MIAETDHLSLLHSRRDRSGYEWFDSDTENTLLGLVNIQFYGQSYEECAQMGRDLTTILETHTPSPASLYGEHINI